MSVRQTPRRRIPVSAYVLRTLRPLFRYSSARDAHVLRLGGGHRGPVLVEK